MVERSQGPNLAEACRAEVYFPKLLPWEKVGPAILALEKEAFPEDPFSEETLKRDFTDPANTVVLLHDPDGKIIGFSYVVPLEKMKELELRGELTLCHPPRDDKGQHTAYIRDTVVAPDFQGQGLVWKMMDTLEIALSWRAWFLERDARVDHSYARKIRERYGERVIFESSPHDSSWGPQVFFRIRL